MGDSTPGSVTGTLERKGYGEYFNPSTGRYMREDMNRIGIEGTAEEIQDYYNENAEHYDEYCKTLGRDLGAVNLAKIVQDLQSNKEARILDVACGNGILAVALKKDGYTNIDGLDFAQKMLDLCKSKGLYKNAFRAAIEVDKKVPQVTEGSYDVACINGSMCIGCITPSHIPAIARLVKPGGHVVFNITTYAGKTHNEYKEEYVVSKLQSFTESGILSKWSKGVTNTFFRTTGEEASVYFATVA